VVMPLLLVVALLASGPPAEAGSVPDHSAYEAAKSQAGRGAEGQVRLALWCESRGLTAERVKHLALAVLSDPRNATARGLLGLVEDQGRWERPEAVTERVKADEALGATLAEYNARRERAAPTDADAQWALALWCEKAGLAAEAKAHLGAVVRIDPARDGAWKRLGYVRHGDRWVTAEQLADERREAAAQHQADARWRPLLVRWRAGLRDKGARREAAERGLEGLSDPRAAPAVWAAFGAGDAEQQGQAVRALGRIDAPGASRALATLAVAGRTAEVRRAATETLRRRDARDFLDLLIGLVRKPLKYEVRPTGGLDQPGVLFVEGEQANVRRVYNAVNRDGGASGSNFTELLENIPPRIFGAAVPFTPYDPQNLAAAAGPLYLNVPAAGGPTSPRTRGAGPGTTPAVNVTALAAQRDLQIAGMLGQARQMFDYGQQRMQADVLEVEAINADIEAVNDKVLPSLSALTGQDLGASADAWQSWWADQRGYALSRSPTTEKPTYTEFVSNPNLLHHACFGAGTLVRTLDGPRPIESVRVGDQALSQDSRSGRLSYRPVVAVYHNKPASTLRIKAGGEAVVATPIHRFWKAGQGWVMARELKAGDALRTLGGSARIESIEDDAVRPVFNLELADGDSYFVGGLGALVHDNSLVRPVAEPFDAATVAAASAPAGK